jgi:hypothetical protein
VLEIRRCHAAIVGCHASAAALELLARLPSPRLEVGESAVGGGGDSVVERLRVAPDEMLLLAPPSRLEEVRRWATTAVNKVEPGALVLDQSDGWAIFSLLGDDGLVALRQLAMFPFPETRPVFLQGAVAGGSAKLLLLPGVVHLLVPYPLRDHVERRLRDVCGPARLLFGSGEVPFRSAAAAVLLLPLPSSGPSVS